MLAPPREELPKFAVASENGLKKIIRQIIYLWSDYLTVGNCEEVTLEIHLPRAKPPISEEPKGEAKLGFETRVPEPRLRVTLEARGFEIDGKINGKSDQEVRIPEDRETLMQWLCVIPVRGSNHELIFSFKAERDRDDFPSVKVEPHRFIVKVRDTYGLPLWVLDWPMKLLSGIFGILTFVGGIGEALSGFENLQKLLRKFRGPKKSQRAS